MLWRLLGIRKPPQGESVSGPLERVPRPDLQTAWAGRIQGGAGHLEVVLPCASLIGG